MVLGLGLTSGISELMVSISCLLVYVIVILISPYHGLLLWLILYPFAETRLNIPLGAGIADLSPTRLVIACLSLMLLAQVAIGKRRLPHLTALDLWGGLFVAGLGFSALASGDVLGSVRTVVDSFLTPLLFYFLARNLVSSQQDLERLFDALLIIGGYTAVLAIHEQLTGQIVLSPTNYRLNEYAGGLHILRSLWGNNAVFGSIFAVAIPLAFYRFIVSASAPRRAAYGLLAGILLLSMFLTYKRGAWLSMLVSFVVMAALFPASRRWFLLLLVVVSIPLALSWNRLMQTSLVEERVTYQLDTLNGRTGRWETALDLWRRRPLLGLGFKSFDQLSGYQAVENHYLHILVSGGLVAFAPFAAFWLLTLGRSAYFYIRGPTLPGVFVSRPILAVYVAVLSTYLVKATSGVQSTPVNLVFYLLIGAVIGSQDMARHGARTGTAERTAISLPVTQSLGAAVSARPRVLVVVRQFSPWVGGTERQAQKLSAKLMQLGTPVQIVTGWWQRGTPRYQVVDGVPVFRNFTGWNVGGVRGLRRLAGYLYMLTLFWHLWLKRQSYDVIHVHLLGYAAWPAVLAGRWLGKRTLIKIANSGLYSDLRRMQQNDMLPGQRRMLPVALRADRLVALSPEIVDELQAAGVPPGRIAVIPNGVELTVEPKRDYSLGASLTVTYVGRLHPSKGLGVLLPAFQQATKRRSDRAWRLWILGDGPLRSELEAEALRLELNEAVQFCGQVDDVNTYLAQTDLFVLPSLSEGLSNALLEAMARGLPCIASHIGGNTTLIRHGETGLLVRPQEVGDLADAFVRLADDGELRTRLGQRARELVEAEYELEAVARRYQALYASLYQQGSQHMAVRARGRE